MQQAKDGHLASGRRKGNKAKGTVMFTMQGETHSVVRTAEDVQRVVRDIEHSRQEHATAINGCSSRSHCVVQATLLAQSAGAVRGKKGGAADPSPALKRGATLTFVDLAGSERLKRSNSEGQRKREAVMVNQSLTTLGRCIRGLAALGGHHDGARAALQRGSTTPQEAFIPVRDSALTKLLCKVACLPSPSTVLSQASLALDTPSDVFA